MLRVPVHKIEPGMVLARPIPVPRDPRRFLLQRDQRLTSGVVPRLRELGVLEVWIRYRNLEFLEDVIDAGLGESQREVYSHVRENFESIMNDSAAELDMTQFVGSISDLFDFLKQSSCGNVLLQKLDAFDNYLMSHSTNVCYLAMLLGMKLERYLIEERPSRRAQDAKDLKELGLGCILHDVGKMKIPTEVLNKPGKLSGEEMELVRQHPTLGYEMVKGRVPSNASQVVLNHHQRYNGEGYPARFDFNTKENFPPLRGKQVPILCRIATVCDVYDAATTKRCYSEAKPPVQVLHEMKTWCDGFFDPVVFNAFLETIPPFPIGQIVTLCDGSEAAVVDFNPRHPNRPKIQCLRRPNGEVIPDPSLAEIDLAIYTDMMISHVDGVDVRPFQVSPLADRQATLV